MVKRQLVLAIAGIALCQLVFSAQSQKVDFVRDVQPILRQNCYGCHGPQQQMNNFRLDRRRDALRGGTIPVIGPGNSEASRLYWRLIGNEYGPQMPPTGALKPEQIAVIKAWIDQGADWPDAAAGEAPPRPADPNATRAIQALRAGDFKTLDQMAAIDPKVGSATAADGSTPLMYAALYADAARMKTLLDAGANANAANDAGATALMWAVDDLEKVRLLVERGANVNAKSADRRTPLMIAAGLFGAGPVVRLLVERGADINAKAPGLVGDTTPIAEAAYSGDEDVFRFLVERGADVNAAGPGTLGLALRAQCKSCIEMTLKSTAPALFTPTMVLSSPPLGPALATPLFLEHGADVNATDPQGRTMLMLTCASDAIPLDAAKALIAKGANVNAKSPAGETALSLARTRGNTPLVDLLLKSGATDTPLAPASSAAKPAPAASIRAAIERTVPLVQKNDETFLRKAGCVSCHNNTLTAETVAAVRAKGLSVNEPIAASQRKTIGNFIETWRERALQANGIPGDADTVSYILLGLAAEKFPADAATDAMVRFLKRLQTPNGNWLILAHRPPLESSDIEVTAASMRAIQRYAPKTRRAEYDAAIQRAAAWLAKATPQTTEDRAFHLLGLGWAAASKDLILKAGQALVTEQRADGGWAQLPSLSSDAYATGQALTALAESGAVATSDPAFKRGVQFLLSTQCADGSWFVKSRAIPLQPHFESGFPYGRDQFISAAGTNWAARALAAAYTNAPSNR